MLFTVTSFTQSSVTIKINHLLDGVTFEQKVNSQNDMGNDFMVERLEYYLSNFAIKHDGGQVIKVKDFYYLVDLNNNTTITKIELGDYNLEVLEGVSFYLGIENDVNHGDPALWPSDHPLAPKSPSMHWGWSAGYRFIALEGKSGTSVDQQLEFHCIGDEFFKNLEFPISMPGSSDYVVELDAEYTQLLSAIDVSGGVILHGSLGKIKTLASNLQTKVFSLSSTTSINEDYGVEAFNVFPNPSLDDNITIDFKTKSHDAFVEVFDLTGRKIFIITNENSHSFKVNESGLYIANLISKSGTTIASKKFLVQ